MFRHEIIWKEIIYSPVIRAITPITPKNARMIPIATKVSDNSTG